MMEEQQDSSQVIQSFKFGLCDCLTVHNMTEDPANLYNRQSGIDFLVGYQISMLVKKKPGVSRSIE